jgi:hypothetical protein
MLGIACGKGLSEPRRKGRIGSFSNVDGYMLRRDCVKPRSVFKERITDSFMHSRAALEDFSNWSSSINEIGDAATQALIFF